MKQYILDNSFRTFLYELLLLLIQAYNFSVRQYINRCHTCTKNAKHQCKRIMITYCFRYQEIKDTKYVLNILVL